MWSCNSYADDDLIFEKKRVYLFMQVVFKGAYLVRVWSLFQREDTEETVC
jgi:hypothetical protein